MVASASLKLYLLTQVGIATPPLELETHATGSIIGAGTKPRHDRVTLIEKKKENGHDFRCRSVVPLHRGSVRLPLESDRNAESLSIPLLNDKKSGARRDPLRRD